MLRHLKHDADLLREYDSVIKTELEKGIVEVFVQDPAGADICGVHYLPHHAVVRRDKETTKISVIYDASAKTSGLSLNECLNPGPKFDQRIVDLLSWFRLHRIAAIVDIEKAFLMISVAVGDHEFLRFLWVDDPSKEDPSVVVYWFARVVSVCHPVPFY